MPEKGIVGNVLGLGVLVLSYAYEPKKHVPDPIQTNSGLFNIEGKIKG
jgi:hypothetical protein